MYTPHQTEQHFCFFRPCKTGSLLPPGVSAQLSWNVVGVLLCASSSSKQHDMYNK